MATSELNSFLLGARQWPPRFFAMPSEDRSLQNIGKRGVRARAMLARRVLLPLTLFATVASVWLQLSPALLHPLLTALFVVEAEVRTHFCILKGAAGACPRPGLARSAALAMLGVGAAASAALLFAASHAFGCRFDAVDYLLPVRPIRMGGSRLRC